VGVLAVSLLGVAAPAASIGASAARLPVLGSKAYSLPGSTGFGTYKPSEIFNGGDPSGRVQGITWTGWGTAQSYGYGKSSIFMPNGGYYPGLVRVELRASNLGHCTTGGPLAYERLAAREPSHPGGPLGAWFAWAGSKTICRSLS
jgi:hypothetical protein